MKSVTETSIRNDSVTKSISRRKRKIVSQNDKTPYAVTLSQNILNQAPCTDRKDISKPYSAMISDLWFSKCVPCKKCFTSVNKRYLHHLLFGEIIDSVNDKMDGHLTCVISNRGLWGEM